MKESEEGEGDVGIKEDVEGSRKKILAEAAWEVSHSTKDHSLEKQTEKQLPALFFWSFSSAIQGEVVQKEKCMNQEYSIMLSGRLFPHFLLLLNVEREKRCCWKKEPHSTPCLQVYPNRPCHVLEGSFPAYSQVFVDYSNRGGYLHTQRRTQFSVQCTIILISSREIWWTQLFAWKTGFISLSETDLTCNIKTRLRRIWLRQSYLLSSLDHPECKSMNIYSIFEIFQENKLEKHKITVWRDWIIAADQTWIRITSHTENCQESSWTRNLVRGQRVNLVLSESAAWENLSALC